MFVLIVNIFINNVNEGHFYLSLVIVITQNGKIIGDYQQF